ncbi:ATP-binding protein [Congregibacter brevis]|uniref:histidine kinase n=1 Tax=Congregibacter brevis TaxID=3081201 RepID=A0ABZ0ID60_9GAMM|nr:ATP-binding protein [Congregibacter sp. IMCC45268]
MSLSIVQKLVAAFIGLTLIVLVATLGLARWSFQQGFLDYVNALEQTRLERIQTRLASDYLDSDGRWDFVTDAYLGNILRPRAQSSATNSQLSPPGPRARQAQTDGPPPPRPGNRRQGRAVGPGPGGLGGPPPGEVGGPRRAPIVPPSESVSSFVPPTALFDANDEQIAGIAIDSTSPSIIRVPVVANGLKVGELRSDPRRQIDAPLETRFSKRQLTTSWIIGLISLGLALVVSLVLARGLSAPVKRMISGVGKLSTGDYGNRMQEQRKDELGQLTRDIDHLASTLEEAQSARNRLLADVSHELRTPLTVLTGEIEALKDGLRSFDATQLESLDQEVQRLRYLVNDLYELSLSDAGGLRYELRPMKLAGLIESLVSGVEARVTDSGLTISVSNKPRVDLPVLGDTRRLEQLFTNVLENSIAYTDAPGSIDIHLSASGTQAVVRFDDSAPGASRAECEKLFEPLYRKDSSRARRSGGAGLGLAICRNIAIAHSGTITAVPSPRGGVSVVLEIPLSKEERL